MKYLKNYKLFETYDSKMEWNQHFEILSFRYEFFENDFRIIDKSHPEFIDCISDCVKSEWKKNEIGIYSVKRLSDGEVFTLGDEVESVAIYSLNTRSFGTIDKIWPQFDQMRADIYQIGLVLNYEDIKVKQKGE